MGRSGETATAQRKRVRPAIGVMLDNVDDGYQRAVWAGIEAGGREAGVDVFNFLGGFLAPDEPAQALRNRIFELIGPEALDGLLVASALMAPRVGSDWLDQHCRRFRPLPMLSLGFALPSMPAVVCDGEHGMRDLVEHLLDHHGRRRFLFIGGAPLHADSRLRERVLVEVLARRGLSLDPRLLRHADFHPDTAAEAVAAVVREGLQFDAVVCANDEMALGVLQALEEAGLRVPEDVSVTGFDDIPAARGPGLPLTTVRQPTFELARRAVHQLLRVIEGEAVAAVERHTATLIVRRTCGCMSETVVRAGAVDLHRVAAGGAAALPAAVCGALAGRGAAVLGGAGKGCVEELAQVLAQEIEGVAPQGEFVRRFDAWLRTPFGAGLGDEVWEDFLTVLRREATRLLSPGALVEARLHQARVLLREASRRQLWKGYSALSRRTQTLQYVFDNLSGSFDVPTLLDSMARELPRIGVERCYLAVHAARERAYREARLVFAYDEEGRRAVGEGLTYPARQLLPEGFDGPKRRNLIWQPLYFGEEEVGFMGFSLDPQGEISSLALAQQIRSALKASMMMQELQEKDRLLLTVDRMRNEFVANVTHDFRSLVTIIMDSSWLATQPSERRGAPELRELAGIVYEASLRLKVAIDRLLDLASMDEHGLVLRIRKFRPRRFLAELAAFYRPVLAVSGIELEEELPVAEVEDLYTDPDKVEQIMHNLVSNAAKVVAPGRGRIRLSLAAREGAVEISVTDDGEGIPHDRLETIFVRYNAQKRPTRRGGSGIGLAFVKELAAYLKGSIVARSEGAGKGACFTLTLARGKEVFDPSETVAEVEGGACETAVVRQQARQLLESSLRGRVAQKSKPASA
jgi:sigma-B regulation protein RsbU (phosphoserine phosphatase)